VSLNGVRGARIWRVFESGRGRDLADPRRRRRLRAGAWTMREDRT